MTSQLVWISNTGDPTIAHESAYDHLTLEELIALHTETRNRSLDPSYVKCDNLSDALCCDDCGLAEMVEELSFRLRLEPDQADILDDAARAMKNVPVPVVPVWREGDPIGPRTIGAGDDGMWDDCGS